MLNAKRVLHLAVLAAFAATGAACTVNVHEHRGYERQRVVVQEPVYRERDVVVVREPPPIREQVTVVRTAPPPVRVDVRGNPPGRDYVWIDGYWVSQGGRWVWVSGKWDRPPHPGQHWHPHTWERHGDSFELRVGGWR